MVAASLQATLYGATITSKYVVFKGIICSCIFFFIGLLPLPRTPDTQAQAASVKFDWDPSDPPLWTIRPEERATFLSNKTFFLEKRASVPCEDRDKPADLYRQYGDADCKPTLKLQSDGSCQSWDKVYNGKGTQVKCMSFCQIRTYFEWSREQPFAYTKCHYPLACNLTTNDTVPLGSWKKSGSNLDQALEVGISGGYGSKSDLEFYAQGQNWSLDMKEGQCGYFTFIPVKKITCGTLSESVWKTGTSCSTSKKDGANHKINYCVDQFWNIKDKTSGKEVPDGITIFVHTNCSTREPLAMEKQDPAYAAPGVALDKESIQKDQQGWVWNSCSFTWFQDQRKLKVFIRGGGFRDDKIASDGDKLASAITKCSGDAGILDSTFQWFYNDYYRFNTKFPEPRPKEVGASWFFSAIVPAKTSPKCVGDALVGMGGFKDQCVEDEHSVNGKKVSEL
ncbi:hypothetical protein K4K58_000327 [Colletotrichum sp. SAR11_239]|nr:hypothetical protein K4K58_000327 [Colletotrichum sp. SAR11_239]